MTPNSSDNPGDLAPDASKEEIEADIAATRDRLAASVEELAAKADVKGQVGAAARHAKEDAQDKAHEAQQKITAGTGELTDRYRSMSPALQLATVLAPLLVIVIVIIRAARRRS